MSDVIYWVSAKPSNGSLKVNIVKHFENCCMSDVIYWVDAKHSSGSLKVNSVSTLKIVACLTSSIWLMLNLQMARLQ